MRRENYKPRLVDRQLEDLLSVMGAVVVEGPKWCGKTWTSAQHSRSEFLVGSPEGNFQNKQLAALSPAAILAGAAPRMLDEWQEVPALWDAVRAEVDRRDAKGQFILTGSATPNRKGILHSGAGRIGRLRMRPMALWESGDSTGEVSLAALCAGDAAACAGTEVSLAGLAALIVRGGWPGNLGAPARQAGLLAQEYVKALLESDVERLDGKRRDAHKMRLLLRSLARNESTTASVAVLRRDIGGADGGDVDDDTIRAYLDALRRLFVIDDVPPFAPAARSALRVKQAEKRHLADPSLACALLKLTPEGLVNDLETFGLLFEALCVRDLRVYASAFGAEVYHYQDYKNHEFDAVIELPDRRWCGVEIKLGANQIDAAAAHLLGVNAAIRDAGGRPASSLLVLCGLSNAAYRRPDGVCVAPLGMLRP
ncbi:MAG: ATP-binding protein [Planctomycetes bacterium]|nr:ATP-binding protein [Planctomycetota bacterium]